MLFVLLSWENVTSGQNKVIKCHFCFLEEKIVSSVHQISVMFLESHFCPNVFIFSRQAKKIVEKVTYVFEKSLLSILYIKISN